MPPATNSRRLHEGERQQDRLQHHAVHGDATRKIISALTSGDVPDLIFADAPSNILPQNAWDDKIVDVTDVVAPYEVATDRHGQGRLDLLQQDDEEAQLLSVSDQAGLRPVPHLGQLGREGRLQAVGRAEHVGRLLEFLQADAGQVARGWAAQVVRVRSSDHHCRPERWQRVVPGIS